MDKKLINYIKLAIITAFITTLYLVLRNFHLAQLSFVDKGIAVDTFITNLLDMTNETDQNLFQFCQYNVQNMIIFLLCKITGNVAIGINIYYIVTFFAIAFSTYRLLKKVGISHEFAVLGAMLLMLLPFHTDRAEGQIITSSFFMVPIIIEIFYDTFFMEKQIKVDNKNIIIFLLLPLTDLKLSFMAAILMTALCIQRHQKAITRLTVIYEIPFLAESLVVYAANRSNKIGVLEAIELAKAEGLRILDFIIPIRNHFYDRFFNLRYEYDVSFSANGESGLNSMGVLLSVCFLFGLLTLLLGKNKNELIKWLSWINIVVILFANINGLGVLVEYIGIHITFWNRMGIFIIVNSVVIMGICAEQIKIVLKKTKVGNKIISAIIFGFIFVVSILDILLRHAPL